MQRIRAIALVGALLCAAAVPVAAAQVKLLETGSSLLYPLMNIWVKDYQSSHPDVQITTQSTGSGISQAMNGTAQIGASDAYVSDAQIQQTRTLNIPLAISAQQINYNLPELNASQHLHLSGPVLAGIYSGSIQYWDDSQIAELNRDLHVKLPHEKIIPIRRSDGSGDTFIFTQYRLADRERHRARRDGAADLHGRLVELLALAGLDPQPGRLSHLRRVDVHRRAV
jgi:phosphate transport system substrate-binding protein